MRISLPIKLMASYLLVAGLIVVPSLWFLRRSLVSSLELSEAHELKGRVEALRDRLAQTPDVHLDRVVRDSAMLLGLRITLIDKSGTVIHESALPPEKVATMENHHDRPEVLAALGGAYGYDRRFSATVRTELIYGALPLPASGPPRAVVRVAARASALYEPVSSALLALRLAAGGGVSAAIILSLVAALFVSTPLRRMRDTVRAFAQANWVAVRREGTSDELGDLSAALDELGHKLRDQLVEVGEKESLVTQAVQSFPLPAVLLRPDLQPMLINGAFRRFADITAVNEGQRLAELTQSPQFAAARVASEKSGLPIELAVAPPPSAARATVRATLVPLARPKEPPLWLLTADLLGPESEARGPEAVQLHLRAVEVIVEKLWNEQPALRGALAQLRKRLDEAAHAAGRPEAVGVEPVEVAELLARCAAEVAILYPEAAERLVLDVKAPCKVAESAGLGARAVRLFLGGALRALPQGRSLEVTLEIEPTTVKLHLEGATPPDLAAIREILRALGSDVGRVPYREREAAWLSLPRA